MLAILLIVIHEHLSCLLVEGAFWERDYEEALDDFEDVVE